MQLNWKQIEYVLPAFPNVEELILCKNQLHDPRNVDEIVLRPNIDLQNLKFLNLEETGLETFTGIMNVFGKLPNINKLILNKNSLKSLGSDCAGFFSGLTSLSI